MTTEKEILEHRNQSQQLYRKGDLKGAVKKLEETWEMFPGIKEQNPLASVIAGDIALSYLEDLGDYTQALKWAEVLLECHKYKLDSGEANFLKGRIFYEMNELERAKVQFRLAMEKSEGRAFEGADKKYLQLLKLKN